VEARCRLSHKDPRKRASYWAVKYVSQAIESTIVRQRQCSFWESLRFWLPRSGHPREAAEGRDLSMGALVRPRRAPAAQEPRLAAVCGAQVDAD
jgi:hypothetical protein